MSNPNRTEKVTMFDEGRVDGFASDVGDIAGDTASRSHRKANQIVDDVRQLATDRPFSALLTAIGAGLVIGFLTSRH